jgi:hypothetical protein
MRTYLASLLLAMGLAVPAMADSAPSTSTTTVTAPAPAPAPNAAKLEELMGTKLPPFGPIIAAEQVNESLQHAALSPKTKLEAKKGLDTLKQELDVNLGPLAQILDHAVSVKKSNERAKEDLIRRMNEHEGSQPGENATQGDVDAYNARADQLNQEAATLNEKINHDNDKFTKDFADASDKLEAWMNARAGAYVDRGQKLLSGEILDDSPAYKQLKKAAKGTDEAADVFDGSNTVDARNVPKWKKGEREAELRKPRVQVPAPKNPPPPVPPPATSSDTAKSKPAKPSR